MTWRRQYPVLVTEAQTIGSIGVIRSLGRGGYPVHACAKETDALGLKSNYAVASIICPDYNQTNFLKWLKQYINQNNIRAIIPSEGLLLTLRPMFSEFAHLLPFSNKESVLYMGMSKFDMFKSFMKNTNNNEVASHIPPTLLVDHPDCLPHRTEIEGLGSPLYIKVDGCHAKKGDGSAVHKASSVDEAYELLKKLIKRFHKVIVQGHVPGKGVGVFFLQWQGRLLAEFMHLRLHEVPHTGGVSSLRESWWHIAIRNDALSKLKHLAWEGVAMMEYRWDPETDQFYLMEMNGRFWGSLHLAIYAGIDFPLQLLDAFHGRINTSVKKSPLGIRCRYTFPKEVQYIWSKLKDQPVTFSSSLWSVIEFVLLSFDPRVYSDLSFPGDKKLYWVRLKRFIKNLS